MKLPNEFVLRMQKMLKDEADAFMKSYEKPRKSSLRTCSLKIKSEDFKGQAPFHVEPVPWVKNGFFYNYDDKASAHPYYKCGLYYLQEASAMTAADRFPINKGERVLDLCAAPGGKATELAAKLCNTGLLMANEVSPSRVKALLYNLESCGAANIIVTNEKPICLEEKYPEYFDKILVDAPCSGEGMFRKSEEAVNSWSAEKVNSLASLQKSILKSAVNMLRPGGMLMYSTCTFSADENEKNVSWVLDSYPQLSIVDIEGYAGFANGRPDLSDNDERVKKAVRIWPHKMDGEGHFLALFKKEETLLNNLNNDKEVSFSDAKDEIDLVVGQKKKSKKKARENDRRKNNNCVGEPFSKDEKRLFFEFAVHINEVFDTNRLVSRSGKAYLLPEPCPDLNGIKYLRTGLLLGEFKKDRFEPSQSLALYLKADDFDNTFNIAPDDERIRSYLRGETISVSENDKQMRDGWILIACDGFPLGFGKLSGLKIKNKLSSSRRETS